MPLDSIQKIDDPNANGGFDIFLFFIFFFFNCVSLSFFYPAQVMTSICYDLFAEETD